MTFPLACLLALAAPAAAQVAPMSDAAFGALLGQVAQQALKKPPAAAPAPRPKSPYPPMKASASMGDAAGNDLEIEVESRVEVTTDIPESFRTTIRKFYEPFGQEPPKVDKLYLYRYEIVNKSDVNLQVNFSDWSFTHSPFTEILQGFQLEVPARRTYKLSYVSTREPKHTTSPMNVGLQDPKTGRFSYVGAGKASFYYPDWIAPFETVDNGLVPPPDPRKP